MYSVTIVPSAGKMPFSSKCAWNCTFKSCYNLNDVKQEFGFQILNVPIFVVGRFDYTINGASAKT